MIQPSIYEGLRSGKIKLKQKGDVLPMKDRITPSDLYAAFYNGDFVFTSDVIKEANGLPVIWLLESNEVQ